MSPRHPEPSVGALVKKLMTPRRTDGPFAITDPEVNEDPDPASETTFVMPEAEAIRRATRAIGENPADGDEYEQTIARQIETERQHRNEDRS